MTDRPGWRRVFDAVERNASPRVEALVHSDECTRITALVARSRRLAGNRANAITARVWHLVNLPAGTDLRRLRMQVGALDREVERNALRVRNGIRLATSPSSGRAARGSSTPWLPATSSPK
jgi:hypothetical protein